MHGGSGVSFGVIEQLRQARPQARFLELVHRLDKETSGLLLVAKKRSALVALQDQFRRRETGKTYSALVAGVWPASRKVVDLALHKALDAAGERHVRVVDADDPDGRRSITLVKVLDAWPEFTLLDVTIKTGRTHQIRVHLAHEGHPIVGDPKYGDFALNRALARGDTLPGLRFGRMFLHARRLRFEHPTSGEDIELESPLPAECMALLDALRTRLCFERPKHDMSHHLASIHWQCGDADFVAGRYSRAHVWRFDGGAEVRASSSPQLVCRCRSRTRRPSTPRRPSSRRSRVATCCGSSTSRPVAATASGPTTTPPPA